MLDPNGETRLLSGEALHEVVVREHLLEARAHVWIATADLKDMHVREGRRFRPILAVFDAMASRGVSFRVVHGNLPSRPFRDTLETYPRLTGGALELQICPRSHWKLVLVDEGFAYFGSANFTGAGLGGRAAGRRNLEIGMATTDASRVAELRDLFETFWIGDHCEDCRLRERCPDPIR